MTPTSGLYRYVHSTYAHTHAHACACTHITEMDRQTEADSHHYRYSINMYCNKENTEGQLIGGPAACLPAAVNPTGKYLSVERQCCPHLVRSNAHLLATGVTWVFFVSPETRRIHTLQWKSSTPSYRRLQCESLTHIVSSISTTFKVS